MLAERKTRFVFFYGKRNSMPTLKKKYAKALTNIRSL